VLTIGSIIATSPPIARLPVMAKVTRKATHTCTIANVKVLKKG
jgi:hypothetical protein